jgi:hypothetical protein
VAAGWLAGHEAQLGRIHAQMPLQGRVLLGGQDHVGARRAPATGEQPSSELPVAEVRGDEHRAVSRREHRVEMLIAHALSHVAPEPDRIGAVENEQVREERAEVGEGVVHGDVELARRRAREHALRLARTRRRSAGRGAPYPRAHGPRRPRRTGRGSRPPRPAPAGSRRGD